ncbi:MAG TPA: DUF2628 domain-containing protein [Geminicoccaceae bacterium]|nr:DUF2628 domain-containing protein [Geminicoccaceae bacterium]
MLQLSSQNKPELDEDEQPKPPDEGDQPERPFARLRPPPPAPAPPLILEDTALSPDAVVPFDSTKTFVGPNGTYYDERWRWMEWRGKVRSWNWSAALTFGGWLAYRRLYALAVAYLGWLTLLLLLGLNGASLPLLAGGLLAAAAIVGFYGNALYQQRFRRMALKVAQDHRDYAARVGALAASGGIDRRAVWILAVAGLGLGGLLVALDNGLLVALES